MSEKIVYLMRGLPSCGKSYTAKKLAGDTGVVCETDEYFYTHVGEDPKKYDYKKELMGEARRWNFARFAEAVDAGVEAIVVDHESGIMRIRADLTEEQVRGIARALHGDERSSGRRT